MVNNNNVTGHAQTEEALKRLEKLDGSEELVGFLERQYKAATGNDVDHDHRGDALAYLKRRFGYDYHGNEVLEHEIESTRSGEGERNPDCWKVGIKYSKQKDSYMKDAMDRYLGDHPEFAETLSDCSNEVFIEGISSFMEETAKDRVAMTEACENEKLIAAGLRQAPPAGDTGETPPES